MQTNQSMSWKELQDQFQNNLENFNKHFALIQNSVNELKNIYTNVMEKSKDDSYELRKEFANLWLSKIDVSDNDSLLAIRDEYDTFLNGPKPVVSDFKNFEAALEQKLYLKSISSLKAYDEFMHEFFRTWKTMWKNKRK
ncbi:hypothetical protein NsoK4_01425 [Nitrosopumilus sp. K4]|uniref:hypothetical protein n=1 Tax=Nitrosopumilus sp. K4 TaxID=2795383 RepID=UPI001BAC5847|nr:hypothetical protein [Nitrosopumilus sp. K4]QUC64969.1 hypothetical protein NsoK4_01425 [Nitrosopumilus sp. K4]